MKHIHGGNIYQTEYELDFSANINPLGMPASVICAACEGVRQSTAYPDPDQSALRKAIAGKHGVTPRQVICGNGAAELLFMLCAAMRRCGTGKEGKTLEGGCAASKKDQPGRCMAERKELPGGCVAGLGIRALLVIPGFAEYERALAAAGSEIRFHSCREENGFALGEEYLDALTPDLDIAFLCIPNNPTGAMIERSLLLDAMEKCRTNRTLLVADECFVPLTDRGEDNSLSSFVDGNPCLFVLRAFTKLYGMPGLRLGYGLCGNEGLLEQMRAASQPWNVSLPAQMAGVAALGEDGFEERSRTYVKEQRAFLTDSLKQMGISFFEPGANFIFFKGPADLGAGCARQGILIRDCSNFRGLGKGYWRIAVRTETENRRLVEVLRHILPV